MKLFQLGGFLAIMNGCSCKVTDHGGAHVTLVLSRPSYLDVVPDILHGSISYTCRNTHMQVEDLLEMIASLRVFKLPNFKTMDEFALGFWWHISSHVAYKKLMLQGYFLTRDYFHICDKFAHATAEKDEVCDCVSPLVC